jgi:xylulokinase
MSILGLDVGTSTCKGIVLSAEGKLLAQKQLSYAEQVILGNNGAAEISADCFWENTAAIIRELASEAAADPIEALAVSSHGESLIPIDAHGQALMPVMLSMDRRCRQQSEELIQRLGQEKLYGLTGSMMHPQFPVPKVMWIKKEHPELAQKVLQYDSGNDYIYRKLGFPHVVDYSVASRFGGFDIQKHRWSEEILAAAGLKKSIFSEPVCSGTLLGMIPKEIASELGLGENVKAVAGGHDQPCASIGMGNVEKGTVTVSAGSYECAAIGTRNPLNNREGMKYGLNSYCHVLPKQYITLAFFVSGMMTKWYLDTFCQTEKQTAREKGLSYFELLESMTGSEPSGICVTPHIYGSMNPEWSEYQTGKITGLTAGATKADLYKAVQEGICCELNLNLQVLEKLSYSIKKLLMTGGGTKSGRWMQMRADITGKQIDVSENGIEASCMGAALLAGIGSGIFLDLDDANAKISRSIRSFVPANSEKYVSQKAEYLTLHRPGLLH